MYWVEFGFGGLEKRETEVYWGLPIRTSLCGVAIKVRGLVVWGRLTDEVGVPEKGMITPFSSKTTEGKIVPKRVGVWKGWVPETVVFIAKLLELSSCSPSGLRSWRSFFTKDISSKKLFLMSAFEATNVARVVSTVARWVLVSSTVSCSAATPDSSLEIAWSCYCNIVGFAMNTQVERRTALIPDCHSANMRYTRNEMKTRIEMQENGRRKQLSLIHNQYIVLVVHI